jgi:hypothetical protein
VDFVYLCFYVTLWRQNASGLHGKRMALNMQLLHGLKFKNL